MKEYKIGDTFPVWFNEEGATILLIRPYTGKYTKYFTHVLKLVSPRTKRGWQERWKQLDRIIGRMFDQLNGRQAPYTVRSNRAAAIGAKVNVATGRPSQVI